MSSKNYLEDMFGAFGRDETSDQEQQAESTLKGIKSKSKGKTPESPSKDKKHKMKRKAEKDAVELEGEVQGLAHKKRHA